MQFRRSVGVGGVLFGGLLLTALVLGALVWFHPEWLGMAAGSDRQTFWLSVIAATTVVAVMSPTGAGPKRPTGHHLRPVVGPPGYRQWQ